MSGAAPTPPPPAPRDATTGASGVPTRARGESRGDARPALRRASERVRKKGGRGAAVVFLIANALPAAGAAWWFSQPPARRDELLARIPEGVAARAISAGVAFGLLVVLALGVLPGARFAIAGLARALHWCRTRPTGMRVLLFPLEALLGLLWFVAQCLFAVDAVAILACSAAFLLYVVRILKPDQFPWLPG
ncbi:MAG: hypothetical protein IT460_09635 [Planctomycetes bacterium]|nr:hypothetical protein [Planctomycetota bacterium]